MSTASQIAANQQNAQLSTGPVTDEGKAAVSKNALKTGLTGRTILLPTDDAELYGKHIESFRARFNPVGGDETELVQRIADTNWRLQRIPGLEAGIYVIGRAKFADLHKDADPEMRPGLLDTEVFLAYEKQFRNLQTHESRLRRALEKDMAALKEMQLLRAQAEIKRITEAAKALIEAIRNGQARSFDPAKIGFEFSLAQIEARAAQMEPQLLGAYQANKPRHLRNTA
jgi:hypothetical protein